MERLVEIIKGYKPKSICWYPSAGNDVQIINSYLEQAQKIRAIQPDFFIFSDQLYSFKNVNEILIVEYARGGFFEPIKLEGYEIVEVFHNVQDLVSSTEQPSENNVGIVLKKGRIHILLLAIDNTSFLEASLEKFNVESLIFNRPMWYDSLKEFISENGVKEVCAGSNSSPMMYFEENVGSDLEFTALSENFQWETDAPYHINNDFGTIIKLDI